MRLVLIGQPGSGKGTQSQKLSTQFLIRHISIGYILRNAVKQNSVLGIQAKEYMDNGELVPDELIIKLVDEELRSSSSKKGFILDGYPRNISQARNLTDKLNLSSLRLDFVIYLSVSNEVLVERLSGRRISEKTGREYHIKYKKSKIEGICDVDGSKLIQRTDDMPDKILKRISLFNAQTALLYNYYKDFGNLVDIDANGTPSEVSKNILNHLKEKR